MILEKYAFYAKNHFFEHDYNYIKVRDHCHYNTPREIPVIFHNGSTYDYHFIIKGLAEEFEGEFECLGVNKEKYITFFVPIKKRV